MAPNNDDPYFRPAACKEDSKRINGAKGAARYRARNKVKASPAYLAFLAAGDEAGAQALVDAALAAVEEMEKFRVPEGPKNCPRDNEDEDDKGGASSAGTASGVGGGSGITA